MQPTLITSKENYLGIEIDQSRDAKLNSFSIETLKDRYLWGEETNAQQAFARASVYGATFQ